MESVSVCVCVWERERERDGRINKIVEKTRSRLAAAAAVNTEGHKNIFVGESKGQKQDQILKHCEIK